MEMSNANLPTEGTLEERVAAFKSDPDKLRQVNDCLDHLMEQARKHAETRYILREKSKLREAQYGRGVGPPRRRFGRARGFVQRMFDALCNCTQTAAAAARTHARNNPFTRR